MFHRPVATLRPKSMSESRCVQVPEPWGAQSAAVPEYMHEAPGSPRELDPRAAACREVRRCASPDLAGYRTRTAWRMQFLLRQPRARREAPAFLFPEYAQ